MPTAGRDLSGERDDVMSAAEVAELLGMSVDWVWAQARAGAIPRVKLGRYYRFRRQAIVEWWRGLEAANT